MKYFSPKTIVISVDELSNIIAAGTCSNGYCHTQHCTVSYSNGTCKKDYCGISYCSNSYVKND